MGKTGLGLLSALLFASLPAWADFTGKVVAVPPNEEEVT